MIHTFITLNEEQFRYLLAGKLVGVTPTLYDEEEISIDLADLSPDVVLAAVADGREGMLARAAERRAVERVSKYKDETITLLRDRIKCLEGRVSRDGKVVKYAEKLYASCASALSDEYNDVCSARAFIRAWKGNLRRVLPEETTNRIDVESVKG